jgi:hypothetical protein
VHGELHGVTAAGVMVLRLPVALQVLGTQGKAGASSTSLLRRLPGRQGGDAS